MRPPETPSPSNARTRTTWYEIKVQHKTYSHSSMTSRELAAVTAVANALFSQLGVGDLASFTAIVRHDTDAVIEVLESVECRAAADLASAPLAAIASPTAEVGITAGPRQMRDASSTAAFASPAAKVVLQVGNFRAKEKDKSCQTNVHRKDAAVGTCVGMRVKMVDRAIQAESLCDLEARMMHECQSLVAPQLERAVVAAEAAELRIRAQLKDHVLAMHANSERRSRDAAAVHADRIAATAERHAAKALCDEAASL
jgi:hypothetical protein